MKFKIFLMLLCGVISNHSLAKNCMANPPTPSVDSESKLISDYQLEYDEAEQTYYEAFELKDVGSVMVTFHACHHLTWKAIFLSAESFVPKLSQNERFDLVQSRVKQIPLKSENRFNEFIWRLSQHSDFVTMSEVDTEKEYWVWKKDETIYSNLILEAKPNDPNSSKLSIELDVAL